MATRMSIPPLKASIGRRRRMTWGQALALLLFVSATAIGVSAALVTFTDPARYPTYRTGLWWAITTITTVGYGDVVPSSMAGQAIGACLMLLGIASFALLTAIAASSIVVGDVGEEERRLELQQRQIERTEQRILHRLDQIERQLRNTDRQHELTLGAQQSMSERDNHGG
jgi:voltage-gated potassium channel